MSEYTIQPESNYDFSTPTAPLIPPLNNLKKEMAAYASALTSEKPMDTYRGILTEMEETGNSQYINSVVGMMKADEDIGRQQTMMSILSDPTIPKEEKKNAILHYQNTREVLPSLRDKYVETVAAANKNNDRIDPKLFTEGFFQTELALDQKQKEITASASTWDTSTWKAIGGALLDFTPFVGAITKGYQYTEVLEALKNEDQGVIKKVWGTFINGILQGSAAKEVRDYIDNLPTLEQKSEAVKKILRTVENLPGTDFNRWTFITQALDGDMANWEKHLYNTLGLVGGAYGARAIIGTAAKATSTGVKAVTVSPKTITVDPKSMVGSTAAHNPELAGKLVGEAIIDRTGEIAASLGASRGHLVGSMLPKVDQQVVDALGPEFNQSVHNIVNALDAEGKTMLNLTEQAGILYTGEARSALNKMIGGYIASTKSAALHLGKSSVQFGNEIGETTEYGAKGSAVFGKTPESSFNTYGEALAAMKELAGELPTGVVSLVKVEKETGKLVNASQKTPHTRAGEFYIKYDYNKVLNPDDIAIFGKDAVKIEFDLFGRRNQALSDMFTSIAKSGKIGGYFFAHHMMPVKATNAAFSSYDKALRMEDQFLAYARKYISTQSSEQRKIVAGLLDEGERFAEGGQLGKVFTYDEVIQKSMARGMETEQAHKIAEGYFVYRRLSDWMYTFLDRERSTQFRRDGFNWINSGAERFVGKLVSEADALADVRAAVNKATGAVEALTTDAIRKLYAGGGSLVRLGHNVRNGDEILEYAKVGPKFKTEVIEQGALPYIRGWVPRMYENNYFTTRTPLSVTLNGVKITDPEKLKEFRTTHYASDDLLGAKAKQDELGALDKTGTYSVKAERASIKTMLTAADLQRTSFINSAHRGVEAVPGGVMTDPLEGLMQVIQSTSKTAAMSDFLSASKADFVRQYGNFLAKRGVFPTNKNEIVLRPNASLEEVSEFKNAQSIYNWLEGMMLMQRYDSAVWKNAMYVAGEFAEKYSGWLASALRFGGKHYPLDMLRKVATTLFISMRPARQLLLQPSQLMLLGSIDTSLLNPVNAIKFARDIGALNLGHLYDNVATTNSLIKKEVMDAAVVATGARAMNMSDQEYIKLVTQLKSTGLMQSVDMNTLVDGLYTQHGKKLTTTTVEEVSSLIGGATKALTFNYGRALGFDRGEQWNLIGSWLVARKRFQQKNPHVDIFSKQATEQIAADTREITFSMTRPGMFEYQKNALTLPLQFLAAPHKAILNITTNKLWSPQEKARLMASSFALYGSSGVGMLWVMDDLRKKFGTELSPDQWKLLEGGVTDWGINYLINSLLDEKGEKTELDLARSFSPSASLPYHEFLVSLSEDPIYSVILGPSWSVIDPEKGRVARAIRDIATIHKVDPINPDNFKRSVYRALEVASGGTDWMKYRLARNLHWTVTTNGVLIDEKATVSEAVGALFGIAPTRARTYFESNKFILDQNKEIKAAASLAHDSILAASRKYGDDPDKVSEAIKNNNAFWAFETDESMHKAHTKHFNDFSRKLLTSQEESLHMNMMNGAQYRSKEQSIALDNYLRSLGENDAANRVKALIGER